MKHGPRLALEIALLLAFPFYWIASEIYYARSKRPLGVSTLSDFYQRFGQPARVHELHRDGVKYYELSGHLPQPWVFAVPSSRPAYIFDESGRFVEWCSDPGDSSHYFERWPQSARSALDPATFSPPKGK